ncbi:MAG: hypothetical protein NWQ46_06235 [Spirosomaceae bacterium]|nr:hypothetical protein [Spirosomataceae bacterium]
MNLQKIKEKVWLQIFVIYTRYSIGGAFVFASLIKIKGNRFTGESGAENPINSAWHFFETMYQSGIYWQFLGVGQFVAGGLLMTQYYAKLGAVAFFPIILNVFVITISYYFAYTPVITGGMLLATILLLMWEWDTLKVLFNLSPDLPQKKRLENDTVWVVSGMVMFLFTASYRTFVDRYNIFIWGGVCIIIGIVTLVIGLRKRKG